MAIFAGNYTQRGRENDELPIVRLNSHRMLLITDCVCGVALAWLKPRPLSAVQMQQLQLAYKRVATE